MGGRLAVGVVDQDGSFKTIVAWTNPLSPAIQNEAFTKGDYAKLREYLDFYEHDRANQGFGPWGNVPEGYGYFLVDLREKTILSAQGYTNVESHLGIQISMAMRKDPDLADGMARMVTHKRVWNERDQEMEKVPAGPFTDATQMASAPDAWYTDGDPIGGMSQQYVIGFPGWSISHGDANAEQFEKIRDYLGERKLLTAAELSTWNDAIEMLEAERSEDADNAGPIPKGIAP